MDTNSKKNTELITVEQALDLYSAVQHVDTKKNDKLSYAAGILYHALHKIIKKRNKHVEKLNVLYASTDESGDIKKEGENVVYTPVQYNLLLTEIHKYDEETKVNLPIIKMPSGRIRHIPLHARIILNGYLFDMTEDDFNEPEDNEEPTGKKDSVDAKEKEQPITK